MKYFCLTLATFIFLATSPGDASAADWETYVFVNGRSLGSHRGGFDPFTWDITSALRKEEQQEIIVSVWDPTDDGWQLRGKYVAELQTFSGRTIDVPSCFIAGKSDWGTYQKPGDFEKMQKSVCTRMLGCHLVDGAGHWVQQEQPDKVNRLLLEFLRQAQGDRSR